MKSRPQTLSTQSPPFPLWRHPLTLLHLIPTPIQIELPLHSPTQCPLSTALPPLLLLPPPLLQLHSKTSHHANTTECCATHNAIKHQRCVNLVSVPHLASRDIVLTYRFFRISLLCSPTSLPSAVPASSSTTIMTPTTSPSTIIYQPAPTLVQPSY